MKIALYYSSQNSKGSSANIITRIREKLIFKADSVNIIDGWTEEELSSCDVFIFLVATYGDQELQDDFEAFLVSIGKFLEKRKFAICELGNYYGYEDFSTGAGAIVETYLSKKGAKMFLPITSIDTLPLIDWNEVDWFIDQLNNSYSQDFN